jgi:hypothetical protein
LNKHRDSSGRRAAREILLLCITTRMTPERKERLSVILSGNVEWEYLLALAGFHGVVPLVFHNISANDPGGRFSREHLELARKIYDETLYRNVVLSSELHGILSAFDKRGIPVIALKGIPLAEMLYENLVLRTMADMDILVQPGDLPQARALLNEMGYNQPTSIEKSSHPFHGTPFFRLGTLPFFVELHWDLEDEKLISIPREKLWERAQTLPMQWGQTRVLSFEDTLMFSAIQLFKQADQLKILGDIAELLKKYRETLDWGYIVDAARSWGIGTIVYYSLRRAVELLEAPVPSSVIGELKPDAWRRWAIDFLTKREAFISTTRWYQVRIEIQVLARSLMMSKLSRTLWVLEKNRDRGTGRRGSWFKTAAWIILASLFALGRNVAGMMPGSR